MEIILDLLFELIVEGSIEASMGKKVPLPVRIVAAIILLGIYGGLVGVCVFYGIRDKSWVLLILGIFILIISILGMRAVYKKHRID